MKKFIKSDYFLVSVSVLVSILLWVFVSYEVNPVYEIKVDNVKIEYTNKSNDFKSGKLVIIDGIGDSDSDVIIRGDRGVISKFKGEDIKCTVSLASISNPGTYVLPVSYSTNVYGVNVVKKNPSSIEITVDKVITREFEVVVNEKGKPADGYDVSSVTIEPSKVRVTGPQSYVEKVEKACVKIDVSNAKSDIKGLYKVKLFDSKGDEINNEHLRLDVEYCDVFCKVQPYKDVKVVVHIGGGKNYTGAGIEVVKVKPDVIRLYGSKEKLSEIKRIDTYEINVTNVYSKAEKKATLDLSEIPEGVTVENDLKEVSVELDIKPVEVGNETKNKGE